MTELTLLVIDDRIGSSTSHQRAFVARFAELNQRVGSTSPARGRGNQKLVKTTVDLCVDFIAATECKAGSSLLFLDLNFDSGSLNEFGFPAGREGDPVFGEAIYRQIHQRFPSSLPVVFVTSKPQSESNFPEIPYLNKESVGRKRSSVVLCKRIFWMSLFCKP